MNKMEGLNQTNAMSSLREGVASNLNLNNLLKNSAIALLILIGGLIIGKLISRGINKLIIKLDLGRYIKRSFSDLIVVLIRWSIYILFLHFALEQLGIPIVKSIFGTVLIIIPAFISSLIILFLGFAMGVYLKTVIKEINLPGKDVLSKISFYFVLYVLGVYALKVALIPLGASISNYAVIALSLSIPLALAILTLKPEPNNQSN